MSTKTCNKYWVELIIAAAIALVLFLLFRAAPVIDSNDSRWVLWVSESLIRQQNSDLDEYQDILAANNNYCIYETGQHRYNLFPIGTSLLVLPVMYVFEKHPDWLTPVVPTLRRALKSCESEECKNTLLKQVAPVFEKVLASLISALACALFFIFLRHHYSRVVSLCTTLLLGLGSSIFSVWSRGLWQHGPSFLILICALLLLQQSLKPKNLIALFAAGTCLGFSYLVRPTNSIVFALVTLYLAWTLRLRIWSFCLGAALILVPWVQSNLNTFGTWQPPYYGSSRLSISAQTLEALVGNILSPNRGLLIFTPLVVYGIYGLYLLWQERSEKKSPHFAALFAVVSLSHWVIVSLFPHWWGGHAYGPRLMSDITPFLFFGVAKVLENSFYKRDLRRAACLCIFAAWGFFVHIHGATAKETHLWNITPENIDQKPERIWQWNDAQFFRF